MNFLFLIVGLIVSTNVQAFNIVDFHKAVLTMAKNSTYEAEFAKWVNELLKLEPNYFNYSPYDSYLQPFNCPALAPAPPATSVNQLRPSDIKYVAALGDSLTAALGGDAKTVLGLLFEYRGKSWSIGGEGSLDQTVSMANILRQFSPSLAGFSTGKDFALFDKATNHLNVAVSGQEANHMPDQARELVRRIKADYSDYAEQWKLVTLFIGGNDLCDFCKDLDLHSPETYANDIKGALDILKAELPKTFVNLVTVLNVAQVKELNHGIICNLLHRFECPCAAFPESPEQEKQLHEYFHGYVQHTHALVDSGNYESDDFTVVIQPLYEEMTLPVTAKGEPDLSYFAPDCFHLSQKGHVQAGVSLWNNMLTPVGQKATKWNINEQIACPDPNFPYFYTRNNSPKK